jgi:hypothetical protein
MVGTGRDREARRVWRLTLAAAAGAWVAALVVLRSASAAPPAVTVTVAPADLTLRPGASAQAALVLRNDSDVPATALVLDALTPAGVHVGGLPTGPLSLAARETITPTLTLALDRGSLGGNVAVRAGYRAGTAIETVTGSLSVHVDISLNVDSVVSAELRANLPTLDENTTGVIVLLIHNRSAADLIVSDVATTTTTAELQLTPQGFDPRRKITVRPLDTARLPYVASVNGRTKPGKQMVIFDVSATSSQLPPDGAHVVVTQPVDLQVFGEAALLGVFAVPSLLLLPGALFVVTLGYVAKRFPAGVGVIPDPNTPAFWVLAVGASLLAMYASALFTGRFFFDHYSLGDIAWVWVLSAAAGAVAGVAWWQLSSWYRSSRVPKPGDTPLAVLRKIERTRGRIHLPYQSVPTVSKRRLAVLDFPPDPGSKQEWVAPRIRVRVAPDQSRALVDALNRRSAGAVADVIEQRGLESDWAEEGQWPILVDAGAVTADPAELR